MTRGAKAIILGAALALPGAGRARASGVFAVLSSDSAHYREAFEGFQEAWGSSVPYVVLGRGAAPGPGDAIVAFGSRAALAERRKGTLLVTCLAPGALPDRETLRVGLLPPATLLAARLKALLPRLKRLRVLWTSDFESSEVEELAEAAKGRGFLVLSERVDDPEDLPSRVRSFSGTADALWLLPDPALVNPMNFKTLREYAKAARVPFLAPTEGLAQKGATATLAVSYRDVGRAAAAALKARLLGAPSPSLVHSDRVVVTVNASAAREVGMDLNAAGGVDRILP